MQSYFAKFASMNEQACARRTTNNRNAGEVHALNSHKPLPNNRTIANRCLIPTHYVNNAITLLLLLLHAWQARKATSYALRVIPPRNGTERRCILTWRCWTSCTAKRNSCTGLKLQSCGNRRGELATGRWYIDPSAQKTDFLNCGLLVLVQINSTAVVYTHAVACNKNSNWLHGYTCTSNYLATVCSTTNTTKADKIHKRCIAKKSEGKKKGTNYIFVISW